MPYDPQRPKPKPNAEQALRDTLLRYLCGELPEPDRDRFEQLLVENDEVSRQIAVLEDEILEDYALGALSPRQQHALSSWVKLSERRRDHVRLTQRLHHAASRRPAWHRPWVRWAAAAAILAVAVPFSLLWRQTADRHLMPATPASSTPSHASAGAPRGDLNALRQLQSSTVLLRVERLRAGIVGKPQAEAQMPTYEVQAAAPIRLQILLPTLTTKPPLQSTYSLTVTPAEPGGAPAVRRDGLTPQNVGYSSYLETTLPPDSIPAGAYKARVTCNDGEYSADFRVTLLAPSP